MKQIASKTWVKWSGLTHFKSRVAGVFWVLAQSMVALGIHAQAVLRADSNAVETGNPMVFQLLIPSNLDKPEAVNFQPWDAFLPEQNILNQTNWQLDGQFWSKKISALFFDADTLQLSALPIVLPGGDTAYTNPLRIIVTQTPSPEDLNDMAPIKDIHREKADWTDYLPWILGSLAVLALFGLLFWIINRKPISKVQSRSVEAPAHELALKKLEALSKKQLITKGLIKEHYAELTSILRTYLEKRFAMPALESTTAETLGFLKNKALDPQLFQELQLLLEQADLAKFAKNIPSEAFHEESMLLSRKMIVQMSLPEPPTLEEKNL